MGPVVMCEFKTCTEVSIKTSSSEILFCCFVKHASFDDLLRELNSHYKNGSEWYIPLSDPVDGTSRKLSNQVGYETWIRYGQTQRLDAYIFEAPQLNVDNIQIQGCSFSDCV